MRILILGGSGMLGHQLWRHFHREHETWVTLRRPPTEFGQHGLFTDGRVLGGFDASDFGHVEARIRHLRPEVVLNCVGVIKQRPEAAKPVPSLTLNSLLPHRLATTCGETGARLVLFGTDCVFSGQRGAYKESDISDASDLYGRTKFLGEVADLAQVVTLRSSIIGRELDSNLGLIDWFLGQDGGSVRGFRRAIYSGFTTMEMARIVERVLVRHRQLCGLWQVASQPISKFALLQLVRDKFGLQTAIEPDESFVSDRSLDGSRFNEATGYVPPSWSSMIDELAALAHNR